MFKNQMTPLRVLSFIIVLTSIVPAISHAQESLWQGKVAVGSKSYPLNLLITEQKDGTLSATASVGSLQYGTSTFRLSGTRKGDLIKLKGTSFMDKGSMRCLPSVKLRPVYRNELFGIWGANSSNELGCPPGRSGQISLYRGLTSSERSALAPNCRRHVDNYAVNYCDEAGEYDSLCMGIVSAIRSSCPEHAWLN